MTTPTNLIIAAGNRTFDVLDNRGRKLTVRKLNALDRLRLLKAAGPELALNDAWLNMAALAVSVVEINGIPRPTPVNERQVEASVAELGDDGLLSAAEALRQNDEAASLFESLPEGNSAGTPS